MILEQFNTGALGSKFVVRAADLFCGAGGTSTGLARACKALGVELKLVAINHWPLAIETHSRNHKHAIHLCTGLDSVNPRDVCPDGIDLLLASPECTHHSNARGGKPVSDQSRASGWHVVRWVEALRPKAFVLENVPEWQSWGPLGANGMPLKSKKGETFQALLTALRSLGNQVDTRILVAADYGDPTTRKRLFVMGRLGKKGAEWPAQTHAKRTDQTLLFGGLKPWRTAKEIIDWSIPGESIFERKRPLADSTMRRIAAGLKKFSGGKFILPQQRFDNVEGRSVDLPLHTITAHGGRIAALVEPTLTPVDPSFIMSAGGPEVGPRSVSEPMNTVLTRDHMAVVEPSVITLRNNVGPRSVDEPLPTVSAQGTHIGVARPFLVPHYGERDGQTPRTHSVDNPVPTIPATGGGKFGLVESFLLSQASGGAPRPVSEPVPTIVGKGAVQKVDPYIIPLNHGRDDVRTHDVNAPMPAITTIDAWALIEPFLLHYYGSGSGLEPHSTDQPLATVTAKARFALVRPTVEVNGQTYALDIRFRMLTPRELARAMSFDEDYQFSGNREAQVKQVGNAVPCEMAKALCVAALKPIVAARVKKSAVLLAVEETDGQALA